MKIGKRGGNTEHIPFVYMIKNKTTGMKYIGARYAIGCHPDEMWTIYFTSSKKVAALREKYGDSDFEFSIQNTFETKEQCLLYETKLLKELDCANSLERSKNNKGKMGITDGINDRLITKDSLIPEGWKTGRTKGKNFGKRSPEFCKTMKAAARNRPPVTQETRDKHSKRQLGVTRGKYKEKINYKMEQIQCPNCLKIGGMNAMKRFHFGNCRWSK